MESYFRGFLEKMIERWIEIDKIQEVCGILEYFLILKTDMENAIFGFIIASMYDSLLNLYYAHYYRMPNTDEINEFMKMIQRRNEEIKIRIHQTLNI
jgi:hypothetical protein